MYAGVFYLRYIRGMWAVAEGLIYTMLTKENLYTNGDRPAGLKSTAAKTITVDYGTTNPCVFLEVWDDGETLWVDREYRWDSRSEEARRSGNPQRTDSQYADDMEEFMGSTPEDQCMVVVDPSAASFIAELRSRGVYVKPANNEVEDGIRVVGSLLAKRNIRINKRKLQGTARRDAVLRLGRQGGRAGRGKAREAEGSRPGCVKILLLYGPSKVADWGIGGS